MDSSLIRHNWKKIVISQIILLLFATSIILLTVSVATALSPSGKESIAQEETTEEAAAGDEFKPIGVALAIGLVGLGASLAMGSAASAGAAAITERPENFGRVVIFLVFIEAVAIYGLVVAILLIYG
ncbi:MAG: ATP synthase subunit C [Candidatus Thorarchaeota archaeon]